jgi:hypothetical protein
MAVVATWMVKVDVADVKEGVVLVDLDVVGLVSVVRVVGPVRPEFVDGRSVVVVEVDVVDVEGGVVLVGVDVVGVVLVVVDAECHGQSFMPSIYRVPPYYSQVVLVVEEEVVDTEQADGAATFPASTWHPSVTRLTPTEAIYRQQSARGKLMWKSNLEMQNNSRYRSGTYGSRYL